MAEDREILADAVDVVGAVVHRGMHRQLPRASSQAATCSISASRSPACSMPSIASPTKAWISSASASFCRNAARPQIEQQVLVERARGRAVAALHVVGEDLQFRLVVGLGLLRQQQRMRRHLGVGLLRVRPHDDLALEHAAALAVEHRLEHLAAVAAAGRDRPPSWCRRAACPCSSLAPRMPATRALAVEAQEQLVAHHRAAGGERKLLKRACAPIAAISDETCSDSLAPRG